MLYHLYVLERIDRGTQELDAGIGEKRMKDSVYAIGCLAAGVGAAMARLVYSFFPGFNVMDVLVFGALTAGFSYMRPRRWWLWVAILLAPAMFFVGWTLSTLGIENLSNGVGTGHLLSAILIPLAGMFAGFVAAKRRFRLRR